MRPPSSRTTTDMSAVLVGPLSFSIRCCDKRELTILANRQRVACTSTMMITRKSTPEEKENHGNMKSDRSLIAPSCACFFRLELQQYVYIYSASIIFAVFVCSFSSTDDEEVSGGKRHTRCCFSFPCALLRQQSFRVRPSSHFFNGISLRSVYLMLVRTRILP